MLQKKLTRREKQKLRNVQTNMSEAFNAWIRKENLELYDSMNCFSHRFWMRSPSGFGIA